MGNCCGATVNAWPHKRVENRLSSNLVYDQKHKSVFDKYEVVRGIGVGSIGLVRAVKIKGDTSDRQYALKSLRVGRFTSDFVQEMEQEIAVIRNLDHPNIARAFEVYRERRNIHLVMELCSGGDLYQRQPYSEHQAAIITVKLLSAIKYMHDRNFIHRDLKFGNVMWESKDADAEIKLIDFGLSTKCQADGHLHAQVGTFETMAPEVYQGLYTTQADMWSLGVIVFMLLSGQKPFAASNTIALMNKTISGKYVMDPTGWDDVSVKAKDFVKNLLQVNPKERLTADQAQKHPWIVETKTAQADPEMFQAVVQKLPDYAQALPMKKLALLLVAHSSSSEDVSQLRKVFDQYDADDSGEISFEEFRAAMRSYSDNREDLRHLFDELDVYGNGRLSYTEFLAAALEAQHNVTEEQIAQAFDRMDEDDSGYISFANMRHLLGDTFSKEDVEKILNEVDTAKDGKISYEEFITAFRKERGSPNVVPES